jgi:hypothetical protein
VESKGLVTERTPAFPPGLRSVDRKGPTGDFAIEARKSPVDHRISWKSTEPLVPPCPVGKGAPLGL